MQESEAYDTSLEPKEGGGPSIGEGGGSFRRREKRGCPFLGEHRYSNVNRNGEDSDSGRWIKWSEGETHCEGGGAWRGGAERGGLA